MGKRTPTRPTVVQCQTCQRWFPVSASGGAVPGYCSNRCRSWWVDRSPKRRNRPPRGRVLKRCEWCNVETEMSKVQRFCSPACHRNMGVASRAVARVLAGVLPELQREEVVFHHVCRVCGDPFVAQRESRAYYCSRFCKQVASGNQQLTTPISYGECRRCGDTFVRRSNQMGQFCSRRCGDKAYNRYRVRRIKTNTPRNQRMFTMMDIAKRDGRRCHLCGKHVDMDLGHMDAMGPTLDHLIPVSEGGKHTPENVALAHRSCNSRRGTSGPAQLLLVG